MTLTKSSLVNYKISDNAESRTRVFILSNGLLTKDDGKGGTFDLVKLRHPRSGSSTLFLFSHDNSVVQELFSLSEKRSWLINDSVTENGKIFFSTPVDPLFLVLPYLRKSKEEKKLVPLEDLLIDDAFPDTLRILKLSAINNIHLLAVRKGPEDLNVWMYDEEKILKWLCRKTEKVVQVLQEKQVNVGGSATSKYFIKAVKEDSCGSGRESYLRWAHGLVSEYISDDLSVKLSSTLGLPDETSEKRNAMKRKFSRTEPQEIMKKKKVEEEKNISKAVKPKNPSAKEKAMIKAAAGSKTITNFFNLNK